MFKKTAGRLKRFLVASVLSVVSVGTMSCVRVSNGVWQIREASVPREWPDPTPVGEIEVKQYPSYRAAVADSQVEGPQEHRPLFRELFGHIKRNDIPMTAPVEMQYNSQGQGSEMKSMSFLYSDQATGQVGRDGEVEVMDIAPQMVVSIGVRGAYTDARMRSNLVLLDRWVTENENQWQQTGPPRYLGYNSPFVPSFLRYGEIQIPIRELGDDDSALPSDASASHQESATSQ